MDTAPRGKLRRNPCKDCTKGISIRLRKEGRARDRSIWQRTQDSITGAEPQFKLLAPHPSESSSLWYSFFFLMIVWWTCLCDFLQIRDSLKKFTLFFLIVWWTCLCDFFTDEGQPEEIHRLDRRGRWPGGPFFGGDRDGRHPERAGRVHRSAGAGEGDAAAQDTGARFRNHQNNIWPSVPRTPY